MGKVEKAIVISVIIPTRNRAEFLAPALDSLLKQNGLEHGFEVLVIDNASTDATSQVISTYQTRLPNLRGTHAPEPGLHTGRHTGMKMAQGETLVFADDDIEALPTWLASIEDAFDDPSVAMVGGNNYPLFLESPPDWLNRLWRRPTFGSYRSIPELSVIEFVRPPRKLSPYLVWGCNFAIRKNVLIAAGGFHPDGMPRELIRFRGDGETHVSRYVAESGMKCVFHPGASVYHKVAPDRMTYAYFRQRGFNQGVSDSYTQLRQQNGRGRSGRGRLLRRVLGYARRKAVGLFDSADTKQALEEYRLGHREGFAYHQDAYGTDPEVREWVHRVVYY